MSAGVIIGYDLGSARMGVTPLLDHAPPIELAGEPITLGVDPENIDAAVAVAVNLAVSAGAARAAIEHGQKLFVPKLEIPPNATRAQIDRAIEAHRRAATSMAEAHRICSILQRELSQALTAAGIETQTWARQSWAHRLVQHHQGGITTAQGNEGLRAVLAPGAWELLKDQHQRDAAGVACMWLVDPPAPPKRYRPPRARTGEVEPKPQRAPKPKRRTPAQRIEAGCTCLLGYLGGGRHRGPGPAGAPREVGDEVVRAIDPTGKHGLVVAADEKIRRAVVEWGDGSVDVMAYGDVREAGCRLAPAPKIRGDVAMAVAHGSWLR